MSMIIAAYAGTGKTTLSMMYPDAVVDFICMPYKYYLSPDGDSGEAGKGNPDNVMREDWPFNYVEAIKSALNNGKTLLIPSDFHVLALLSQKNIPIRSAIRKEMPRMSIASVLSTGVTRRIF